MSSTFFFKKNVDFSIAPCQHSFVNQRWIPRSSRWTHEEREQRKIQAQNERGYRKLLYDEKLTFLAEIKSQIILASGIETK